MATKPTHKHIEYVLVWSEDESEEELCDAIRRFTNFSLTVIKQAIKPIEVGENLKVYLIGDYKFKEFSNKASEIYKVKI